MYDVAIIGAGPAGATLARLLAGSFDVLLIDRRRLDEPPGCRRRAKCCGGLLAPDAQKALASLGLDLPQETPLPNLWNVGDGVREYANGGVQACAETAALVVERILTPVAA